MLSKNGIPPRSPFGLIQEDMWPNEWIILVCCMMLNCTTRKQVEKIMPSFLQSCSTPDALLNCDQNKLITIISPLGFGNRRASNLIKMTYHYLNLPWTHANQLPGIGQYASTAWEIFCKGIIRDVEPQDGALKLYWKWYRRHYDQKKIVSARETDQVAA